MSCFRSPSCFPIKFIRFHFSYCMVCKKNFKMSTDLRLRRYPNGVICCYECGKEDSVCPVTGTVFKAKLDA